MRTTVLLSLAVLLAGCGPLGKVEQGRVVAYDENTKRITLIREPNVLPPVTIEAPSDPEEMGPAPSAGGLMAVDSENRRLIVYDRATQSIKTIPYTPLVERRNIAKSPGPPVVDRARKTITLYSAKDHELITIAASDDLLAMPAATWRAGDVVRYYYKDPARALRLMNVTKTDLSKGG
jgi:hypothetical protein